MHLRTRPVWVLASLNTIPLHDSRPRFSTRPVTGIFSNKRTKVALWSSFRVSTWPGCLCIALGTAVTEPFKGIFSSAIKLKTWRNSEWRRFLRVQSWLFYRVKEEGFCLDLEKSLRWGVTCELKYLLSLVLRFRIVVCVWGWGLAPPPAVFLSAEHLPRLVECKDAWDKISTFGWYSLKTILSGWGRYQAGSYKKGTTNPCLLGLGPSRTGETLHAKAKAGAGPFSIAERFAKCPKTYFLVD